MDHFQFVHLCLPNGKHKARVFVFKNTHLNHGRSRLNKYTSALDGCDPSHWIQTHQVGSSWCLYSTGLSILSQQVSTTTTHLECWILPTRSHHDQSDFWAFRPLLTSKVFIRVDLSRSDENSERHGVLLPKHLTLYPDMTQPLMGLFCTHPKIRVSVYLTWSKLEQESRLDPGPQWCQTYRILTVPTSYSIRVLQFGEPHQFITYIIIPKSSWEKNTVWSTPPSVSMQTRPKLPSQRRNRRLQ